MSNKVPTRTFAIFCCVARLFVCGDALNSRRARENLQRLREMFPHVEFEVEVIDVGETSRRPWTRGFSSTPLSRCSNPRRKC